MARMIKSNPSLTFIGAYVVYMSHEIMSTVYADACKTLSEIFIPASAIREEFIKLPAMITSVSNTAQNSALFRQ